MCLCGHLPVCVCVCVCSPVCVAVQKMAEAHMQNLGVYPPLEDPCEGEEDEDQWQGEEGEDTSPTKTAGEREILCRVAGTEASNTAHCGSKENTVFSLLNENTHMAL